MVELTTVSEAIGKFAEILTEKFKKGEKLSSEDYLFLTLYYLSREMELIYKIIDKSNEEIKEYVDKRFDDTNRRIDDLKAYVDKGFENTNKRFDDTSTRIDDTKNDVDKRFDDLKSDIKEIKNDIRMILEILTKK